MTLYRLPACVLALLLLGTAIAQEAANDRAAEAGDSPTAAETKNAGTLSNDNDEDDADDGEQERRPINASTDVFVPTEEVSVDKSISMPVDI